MMRARHLRNHSHLEQVSNPRSEGKRPQQRKLPTHGIWNFRGRLSEPCHVYVLRTCTNSTARALAWRDYNYSRTHYQRVYVRAVLPSVMFGCCMWYQFSSSLQDTLNSYVCILFFIIYNMGCCSCAFVWCTRLHFLLVEVWIYHI